MGSDRVGGMGRLFRWRKSGARRASGLDAFRGRLRQLELGCGSSSDGSSSDGISSVGDSFGEALGEALAEAYRQNVRRLYVRYPYADGSPGFVRIVEPDPDWPMRDRIGGTFTLDGAYLGPTLGRAGLGAELMGRRFGLALDLSPRLETAPWDALTLGSVFVLVAPVLRPRWQVQMGLGAAVMIDGPVAPPETRTDAAGVAGTLRTSVFPVRPLVLRGRLDLGRLGDATTLTVRATLGVMVRRTELFAGYETRHVGRVIVRGPTAGLRVWF